MKKLLIFSGIIAMLLLQSCNQKEEKEETVRYIVTSPIVLDTLFTKEYVAQIKSIRNIEIRSQEKGFLEKIYVDEGQFVKEGQPLFRIMPKIYEAEVLKSQAEAKAAEIEVLNAKTLFDKKIVSKNELAMAQAKLDQARAEVQLAKIHLSFTEIRAPFSGTIDRLPNKIGSLIDEGELLTTLSDNSQMFAYFNVSEPEYLDYQQHSKTRGSSVVQLKLANNEVHSKPGKIELIESEFDNETGNVAFRAVFPNPEKLLKNGETGKILMAVPVRNALIIPQKSTYEIQDKKYVFIVGKNNVLKSREIMITGELPDLYIINAGLTTAEKIVLEGIQKAKDDDKIEFEYKKPKDVLAHLKLYAE